MTEDGRYLLVFMYKGSDNNNRLYYADLGDPNAPKIAAPVKPLIEADDAEFAAFGNAGRCPVLADRPRRAEPKSDRHRRRAAPSPSAWTTIVPEGKEAIETVGLIGGRLVAQYLVDVQSRLSLFGLDGSAQGDVTLPGTGTVAGLGGRQDAPEIFYAFSSPLFPTSVFSYDVGVKAADAVRSGEAARSTSASTRRSSCSPPRRTARACRSS